MKAIAVAALCLSTAAFAAEQKNMSKDSTDRKSVFAGKGADHAPAGIALMFSKPVVFRGILGDRPIQAMVRPKEVIDEGLEGDYFVFGRSARILLAGELDGEAIFLEESENGTSISGHWEGRLKGDFVEGTWTSADGSISKPFSLREIQRHAGVRKQGSPRKATATTDATLPANR